MQKLASEPGQVSYDEVTGLPLDPKQVADAIKEELMFMRELQVYHGDLVSYLDKSGLKAIGTRWVYTNKGDVANPFIRARLVAQGTKRVIYLTPEDASSTFAATPPLEGLKVMLSRCMAGKRRTLAEEKVLGFYHISRAHFHSLARRTIVIKMPREDDECTRGYAVLDKGHVWNEGCCTVLRRCERECHDNGRIRHGQVFTLSVSFERSCHVCV